MVESAYHIEDVAIKKGDIVVNKEKNDNVNGKDTNKPWNLGTRINMLSMMG